MIHVMLPLREFEVWGFPDGLIIYYGRMTESERFVYRYN